MKKYVLLVITIIMLSQCLSLLVFAKEFGFSTEDANIDENMLTDFVFLPEEPSHPKIDCFAVSDDGTVAIGTSNAVFSSTKMVLVFSSDGVYQYGYSFTSYGSFYLEWDADALVICFVRGSFGTWLDDSGNIIAIKSFPDTEENRKHWRGELKATTREENNMTYTLLANNETIFTTNYSKLKVTSDDGDSKILYECDTDENVVSTTLKVFGGVVVPCAAIVAVGISIYKQRKKTKNFN